MKLSFNPNIIVNSDQGRIKFGATVQISGQPERHIVCQVKPVAHERGTFGTLLRRFLNRQREVESIVLKEVSKGNMRPAIELSRVKH